MMWHVVFAESGRLPRSRAARSRDSAIQTACELLHQSFDGAFIERPELEAHYDEGRFPGLRRLVRTVNHLDQLAIPATPAIQT